MRNKEKNNFFNKKLRFFVFLFQKIVIKCNFQFKAIFE